MRYALVLLGIPWNMWIGAGTLHNVTSWEDNCFETQLAEKKQLYNPKRMENGKV